MNQKIPIAVLIVVTIAVSLTIVGVVDAQENQMNTKQINFSANDTNIENFSVGERMSTMVAVQVEEIDGEIDKFTLKNELRSADSNNSKAELLTSKTANFEELVENHREKRETLESQYKNGNISRGEFISTMMELRQKSHNSVEIANLIENESQNISGEILQENKINATSINTLKENASNMTGNQVSHIAQTIGNGAEGKNDKANRTNIVDKPGNQLGNDTR